MILRFLTPASREFALAARYYDEQVDGLGLDYLDELDHALNLITENPMIGSLVYRDYRKMPVKRFPFSIIYKIYSNHILVVAVMHQHRRPGYWLSRI